MTEWLLLQLEHYQDAMEFQALAWTWPTIAMFWTVVVFFTGRALRAIWRGILTPMDWITVGIWTGFLGGSLDNEYWGFAWGINYVEWDSAEQWFQFGVYSNLPNRQLAGVASAYCHLRAMIDGATEADGRSRRTALHLWVLANVVLGYLIALRLFWVKP